MLNARILFMWTINIEHRNENGYKPNRSNDKCTSSNDKRPASPKTRNLITYKLDVSGAKGFNGVWTLNSRDGKKVIRRLGRGRFNPLNSKLILKGYFRNSDVFKGDLRLKFTGY